MNIQDILSHPDPAGAFLSTVAVGGAGIVMYTAKGLVDRVLEEYDYRRDARRAQNNLESLNKGLPHLRSNCHIPDDDWLKEWLDLSGKHSTHEWQMAMGKMVSTECNTPGSVPRRYFIRIAGVDSDVLEEFRRLVSWYVPDVEDVVLPVHMDSSLIPNLTHDAGLMMEGQRRRTADWAQGRWIGVPGSVGLFILQGKVTHAGGGVNVGLFHLTDFGRFVHSLLDPKPAPDPGLWDFLCSLWEDAIDSRWVGACQEAAAHRIAWLEGRPPSSDEVSNFLGCLWILWTRAEFVDWKAGLHPLWTGDQLGSLRSMHPGDVHAAVISRTIEGLVGGQGQRWLGPDFSSSRA